MALDADTDQGREKLKEMMEFRQRPWQGVSTPLTVEDTIDLGLNLAKELERTETADDRVPARYRFILEKGTVSALMPSGRALPRYLSQISVFAKDPPPPRIVLWAW